MKDRVENRLEKSNGLRKALPVVKYLIVLGLIAISVYYTIKDAELVKVANTLGSADYLWVLLSIPVTLLSHYLRALRWKTMLKPILKVKSVYNLFKAVMIGYAANAVTPRGGELLRPYVYARQEKVSFTSTFATIIVERFLDLLTLLSIFGLSLILFKDRIVQALKIVFEKMNVDIQPSNFLFIILILTVVFLVSFYPPVIKFFLRIFLKPFTKRFPFAQKLYDKIFELFEKFIKGFSIIKEPKQYLRIFGESLFIWICYGIPNYLMFFVFDFQSTLHLGVDDAFLILIVVGVAVTIAPTPGALGVHHVAVRFALIILYGIPEEQAVAYAIVTHAVNYILSILVGGYYYLQKRKDIPMDNAIIEESSTEPDTAG